jgi:acylphosphatase
MIEQHITFSGRVQGVGFRAAVVRQASRFHLCGTVRNCEDQSVYAVVQGTKSDIEKFLHALKTERGAHAILEMAVEDRAPTKKFSDFKITY